MVVEERFGEKQVEHRSDITDGIELNVFANVVHKKIHKPLPWHHISQVAGTYERPSFVLRIKCHVLQILFDVEHGVHSPGTNIQIQFVRQERFVVCNINPVTLPVSCILVGRHVIVVQINLPDEIVCVLV